MAKEEKQNDYFAKQNLPKTADRENKLLASGQQKNKKTEIKLVSPMAGFFVALDPDPLPPLGLLRRKFCWLSKNPVSPCCCGN